MYRKLIVAERGFRKLNQFYSLLPIKHRYNYVIRNTLLEKPVRVMKIFFIIKRKF